MSGQLPRPSRNRQPFLVTGFGAFGQFEDNPSAALAKQCGLPHQVLEVSFEAVDEFLRGLEPGSFDALLMLGVAGGADAVRVETVARNRIGPIPDSRGLVQGPGPIDPAGASLLAATLWPAELLVDTPGRSASVDAGTYLCNYVFYRALQAFPDRRVGFLHVPPVEAIPLDAQQRALDSVLQVLGSP